MCRLNETTNVTYPIRSFIALSILAIVLAACGTTVGAPGSQAPAPSEPVAPSVEPSIEPSVAPSEAPVAEEREVAGTITVAEMAFSGPGGTIREAIDNGTDGEYPSLVNGVIFLDTDGTIYMATSVSDVEAPSFEGPMLEVLNMANDGNSWDMALAELNGLEEASGIVFRQNAQTLGFVEIP
jgi:hypothetical protein